MDTKNFLSIGHSKNSSSQIGEYLKLLHKNTDMDELIELL